MARALLVETRMPRRAATSAPAPLTTPFELFYGTQPDYRTLFRWGFLRYFCRVRDSNGGRGQFDMHSSVGIVIGRSNHTNGMIIWDPVTQRMDVSADYKLDPEAAIGTHFPTIIYGGQISLVVLRGGKNSTKEPFPPGSGVQVELNKEYYMGKVQSVPIEPSIPNYQVTFTDSPECLEVPLSRLSAPDEPIFSLVAADTEEQINDAFPSLPSWIKENTHVTLYQDGSRRCGTISSTDSGWTFQQRTASGLITYQLDLADLPVTWKGRLSARRHSSTRLAGD
jgi:hypothetical protein